MTVAPKFLPVALATFVLSGTAVAQTEDFFVSGIIGQTSANLQESSRAGVRMPAVNFDRVIDDTASWGVRAGRDHNDHRYYLGYDYSSDSYRSAASVRLQTLGAGYDMLLPVADTTRLFAGASAGFTRLEQTTSRYRDNKDWGVHAGLQAGVVHALSQELALEVGYRYQRHWNAEVDFKQRTTGGRDGSANLNSAEQLYMGVNWRF